MLAGTVVFNDLPPGIRVMDTIGRREGLCRRLLVPRFIESVADARSAASGAPTGESNSFEKEFAWRSQAAMSPAHGGIRGSTSRRGWEIWALSRRQLCPDEAGPETFGNRLGYAGHPGSTGEMTENHFPQSVAEPSNSDPRRLHRKVFPGMEGVL